MHAKFHNIQFKEELRTQKVQLFIYKGRKMTKFPVLKKLPKNDVTIIRKPNAHPHTMKKSYSKFQNCQYKTVRGVVLTRGTHCLYIKGEK